MKYDSIACEFFLNGVWVDLNAYRLQAAGVEGSMGIRSSDPLDRVATTGQLTLSLLNANNNLTPGHANCVAGFKAGMKFRLRLTLDGRSRTRFYGTVPPDGIEIVTSKFLTVTTIKVVDYMDALAVHQLKLPKYAIDKRVEEVVALILDNMPVKPLSVAYGTGKSTFASVFDTIKDKTRAMQEIGKVALAEFGYVYLRNEVDSDEVLTVENRGSRSGKPLSQIRVVAADGDRRVINQLGSHPIARLTEDGNVRATEPAFVTVEAVFNNNFRDIEVKHSGSYYNQVATTTYPRKVDTANVVLFSLERAVEVGAGQTVTMTGRFRDPSQEAQTVAALSTLAPVSGTDYLFNTAADGSGSDITANLTVTAVYGANGVDYTLINNGVTTGFVTQLNARGKGVYTYRSVELAVEDAELVSRDGARTLNLNLQYQDDPLQTTDIATALLSKYKQKETLIHSVTFVANRKDSTISLNPDATPVVYTNNFLLSAFIDLNVGDKIQLVAPSVGIEQDYFIQAIDFTIASGDVVSFTYTLQNSLYETYDAWILGDATFGVLDTTTVLGF